jgi:hypothetical protein
VGTSLPDRLGEFASSIGRFMAGRKTTPRRGGFRVGVERARSSKTVTALSRFPAAGRRKLDRGVHLSCPVTSGFVQGADG